MKNRRKALLLATMDTKFKEAGYIQSCLLEMDVPVMVMDAGIRGNTPVEVDVTREEIARAGGCTLEQVQNVGHEGKALEIMINGARKLSKTLYNQNKIHGVISLGGSMGTTLGTAVMRQFPIGIPKVMISTMASRDTRSFVGTKDILMLHSVCDLSGLNRISRRVLRNGAMAMAGILKQDKKNISQEKPLVVISTLGTTEVLMQTVRKHLENTGRETVVFHTVGSGGKAMEEMIEEEDVEAVVDLSLHEITDHHFGGDYDAGPFRGSTALKKKIPCILIPGNIDFLVSGPLKQTEKKFPDHLLHVHNAAITAVRSSPYIMETMGKIITDLLNSAKGPYSFLVPLKGFSAFDSKEGPLFNETGRKCFSKTITEKLENKEALSLLPYHINDPEFGKAVIESFKSLVSI